MKLPIHIFTLALDAMKFLPRQLEAFEKIQRPKFWHLVEGVADNQSDTNWCAKIKPRLSNDGTTEWINKAVKKPWIKAYRRTSWPGKTAMCNAIFENIQEPCVLLQVDADEFWTVEQIETICRLYETGKYDRMRFYCDYFVGPNIIVTSHNTYGNRPGEWSRSWLWKPGMFFEKHEPPVLNGCGHRELSRDDALAFGLKFRHEAYMHRSTVEFKQTYYKYAGALEGWDRLQANKVWPVKLKTFMPWVDDGAVADLFNKKI